MELPSRFVLLPQGDGPYATQELSLATLASTHAVVGPAPPARRLTDLSRNLLVIVCEYLAFFEIVGLTSAHRQLLSKLDESIAQGKNAEAVSYLKRRGTLFFQGFFFQQFPSSDIFLKRMTSLTTASKVGAGKEEDWESAYTDEAAYLQRSFLPFVKQSSICERFSLAPPQLSKDEANPFDLPFEGRGCAPQRGSTVTTQFTEPAALEDDQRPINYYINETYKKWKDMYLEAINNKRAMVRAHDHDFYTAFL